MHRWLERAVRVAVGGYVLVQVGEIAGGGRQQDLRAYVFAAATWLRGENPYDPEAVWASPGADRSVPYFLYSPVSLPLFAAFTYIPWSTARLIFLALELIATGLLILVWRRLFPEQTAQASVLLLTLCFGYDQAWLRDLRAGNVSVFEQLLLWLGLACVMHSRFHAGSFATVASAVFKQATLVFLALLPMVGRSLRAVGAAVLGMLVAATAHFLALGTAPELYSTFLHSWPRALEWGAANPSSLVVAMRMAEGLELSSAWGLAGYAAVATAASFCLGALLVARGLNRHPLLLVCGFTFAYALVVPRMKDYSYLLLLMPSLYVLQSMVRDWRLRYAGYGLLWVPFLHYQPWITAFFHFAAFSTAIWTRRAPPPGRGT